MDGPANCPAQLPGRAGAGHTGHRPTPANARRHCGGRGWRRWRRWWRWWRGRWRWRRGWRRMRSGDASRGGGDVRRRMGGGGLETKVAKVGPSPASGRGTQAGSNLLKSDRRRRLTKRSSLHKKRSSLRGRTKVAIKRGLSGRGSNLLNQKSDRPLTTSSTPGCADRCRSARDCDD